MGQISIARGVVAIDPTSAPGVPLYTDVTSPQVLYSGTSGLISGSASFEWINSTSSLELGTGAELYVYNTADKTTNYERGVVKWDTNAYVIGTEKGGSGSVRTLNFQVDGTSRWYLSGSGHFLPIVTNNYDIGASGSLVRSLYYGTNLDGASGATFNLYNTADQTTNYERLRVDWSSNTARIWTSFGGSGTSRQLTLGSSASAGGNPTTYMAFQAHTAALPLMLFLTPSSASTLEPFYKFQALGLTASSGTQTTVAVNPTINQSGTAGYILADFNATETATGSGTKLLQRWAVGGTTRSEISNAGTYFAGNLYCNLSGAIGWSTNSASSNLDLALNRDAADTLALRRSTNAQTFRVYNTYTDASNYERFQIVAGASNTDLSTFQVGTGSARPLRMYTTGAQDLQFGTVNSMRWTISTSGHFQAFADNTYDIGASGANRPRNIYVAGVSFSTATQLNAALLVSNLPSASGGPYRRYFVSDSTVAAAGNYGAVVAGGGANIVPVYSDGTNWRIG